VFREEIAPRAAAVLVRRSMVAATTEIFVRRMTDPGPARVLEGLTDMICRYIFNEDSPVVASSESDAARG